MLASVTMRSKVRSTQISLQRLPLLCKGFFSKERSFIRADSHRNGRSRQRRVTAGHVTDGCGLASPRAAAYIIADKSRDLFSSDTVKTNELFACRLPEAIATRDAMAKCLYGALFDWIVMQVNHALLSKKDTLREHQGHSIGEFFVEGYCWSKNCHALPCWFVKYVSRYIISLLSLCADSAKMYKHATCSSKPCNGWSSRWGVTTYISDLPISDDD